MQTLDGGYIIVGRTESYGAGYRDVWLIKTDVFGGTLWTRTFGGPGDDQGFSVQQTSDGGYIITGLTNSYGSGEYDVWLIKTDASGNTLWTRTFGDTLRDVGNAVLQTSDGGYIIAGTTHSYALGLRDIWLIKTDAFGDTLWTRTFGGAGSEYGEAVLQAFDGGYIIAGSTNSYTADAGNWDVLLIKTDAEGDTIWTVTTDGGGVDHAFTVRQTSDGGYIVVGVTGVVGVNLDVLLIKYDAMGEMMWLNTYGGDDHDYGVCVRQTPDGGYIITGYSTPVTPLFKSYGPQAEVGNGPLILIKTDRSGEIIWTTTFEAKGCSVIQISDGEYIVFSVTGSYLDYEQDICIIKVG